MTGGPTAKVIADSVEPMGSRLTTMEVRLHRFVLAEFNTHRVFSRNSASSRAIPIEKRISEAVEDPAMPLHWGENQRGMQADREGDEHWIAACRREWLRARDHAVASAQYLSLIGLHKQVTNRLLEPFLWHTVVVSATNWMGFFEQRCSPLAQPEMRAAAEAMRAALDASQPKSLPYGAWHLPYVQPDELRDERLTTPDLCRLSVARCARVSYLTHDGVRDWSKDFDLHDRLLGASPPHASPFEHVACAVGSDRCWHWGNFEGWAQLRKERGL